MVQWMLTSRHGVDCFRHYLDHSHVGSPSLLGVSQQFAGMYSAVFQTWPPSSPEQAEGPVYLLGSVTLQARLPAEKRERIITLLSPLLATSTSACKIAPPPHPPQVRTSPHRMSNLLSTFQRDDHPIRLKQEFRLDLTRWRRLL